MKPEEELAIEIGDLNGVHVDDFNVSEAHEREVLEQFAAEASRAHHKDLGVLLEILFQLRAGVEVGSDEIARSGKELVEVSPSATLLLRGAGHGSRTLVFLALVLVLVLLLVVFVVSG